MSATLKRSSCWCMRRLHSFTEAIYYCVALYFAVLDDQALLAQLLALQLLQALLALLQQGRHALHLLLQLADQLLLVPFRCVRDLFADEHL